MSDTQELTIIPPPGSVLARRSGCLCPVVDNVYGHGSTRDDSGRRYFWTTRACPLHAEGYVAPAPTLNPELTVAAPDRP